MLTEYRISTNRAAQTIIQKTALVKVSLAPQYLSDMLVSYEPATPLRSSGYWVSKKIGETAFSNSDNGRVSILVFSIGFKCSL